MNYRDIYQASIEDPESFWRRAAKAISWSRPPETVGGQGRGEGAASGWFPDGELNTCFNAVDRHILAGNGARRALIYDSPVTGRRSSLTYSELQDRVARAAGALAGLGVGRGDRVVIYMPMVPQAVVAMLACARLGAVHSVVFAGFAPRELALRIDDAEPRVVITASCGVEPRRLVPLPDLLDQALDLSAHRPDHCVLLRRPESPATLRHPAHDWEQLVATAEPVDCVPVGATEPLYILYTSGTTGGPKGVVRDNGGHAVALTWTMRNIYGMDPGEVFWAASDIGWVVGHSYIVYAPLLAGATTVLYEGKPVGTPDAGAFWRVVEDYQVAGLFTAPTALRAIRTMDPEGALIASHDLSTFRHLFLAGERLDVDTLQWAQEHLPADVTDHWWQTETGWAITANPRGIGGVTVRPGSAGMPMPGYRLRVVDSRGKTLGPQTEGNIAIDLPLPPGALTTLWRDPERFQRAYFDAIPGSYATGDTGFLTEDGELFVLGRSDDVINVAGHRLSTGTIEGVVAEHPEVAECAVIGARDQLKGQMPFVFVVAANGSKPNAGPLGEQIGERVRDEVGAIATPREVVLVPCLPKTRSGKILRRTLRAMVDGEPFEPPATIEDPATLEQVETALQKHGSAG